MGEAKTYKGHNYLLGTGYFAKIPSFWNTRYFDRNYIKYIKYIKYINDLPDDVICDIAIYADNTTLYLKCDQASDLWQQLDLASKLESDLQDGVDWGRKWLVDFNAWKTQLVLIDQSNNTGAIDVKMDWSVLEEKSSFKRLGLTFSCKFDWSSCIISIAKTASK